MDRPPTIDELRVRILDETKDLSRKEIEEILQFVEFLKYKHSQERYGESQEQVPQTLTLFPDGNTAAEGEGIRDQFERLEVEALRKALSETDGNISRAAKRLGIGRATVYRKARKYNIPLKESS